MEFLLKWGKLISLYDESQDILMLSKKRRSKRLIIIASYSTIALSIFLAMLFGFLPYWVSVATLLLLVTVICIYVEIEISKEHIELYEEYGLKKYPFFKRSEFLLYIIFSKKLDENETLNAREIDNLIQWQTTRNEKITLFKFSNSPFGAALISIIPIIVVEFLKHQEWINSKYIALLFFGFTCIAWFTIMFVEYSKNYETKVFKICKLLNLYKLKYQKS